MPAAAPETVERSLSQLVPSAAPSAAAATLADLAPGASARLLAVHGPRAWRRRLYELGFLPGTMLRLVRRVAVGNVLEVELRSARISLRIDEAAGLGVERLP